MQYSRWLSVLVSCFLFCIVLSAVSILSFYVFLFSLCTFYKLLPRFFFGTVSERWKKLTAFLSMTVHQSKKWSLSNLIFQNKDARIVVLLCVGRTSTWRDYSGKYTLWSKRLVNLRVSGRINTTRHHPKEWRTPPRVFRCPDLFLLITKSAPLCRLLGQRCCVMLSALFIVLRRRPGIIARSANWTPCRI